MRPVDALEIGEALSEPLMEMLSGVQRVLETTPPELAGDVMEHGMVLTGGGAKLVGLSALMTTTVPNMQATIEALHAAHLDCKVMVGGAVLTPDYARDIGADYYCKDAKASADLAKQLLG